MPAYSGHKAAVRVTGAAVTTSTGEAAVLSTDGQTLTITDKSKRFWDVESATMPIPRDGGTAITAAKEVNYVQGVITFTTPRSTSATYTIDVHHLTASSWGNATQWSLTVDQPLLDGTRFGSTWRESVAGLRGAGASLGGFHHIGNSTNPLAFDFIDTDQRVIVQLVPATTENAFYEGYGWIASDQTQAGVDTLIGETVDLTIDGELYYTTGIAF